jgi:hypothetical protein
MSRVAARRLGQSAKQRLSRFGAVKFETHGDQHAFEVEVYVDDLDPGTVQIDRPVRVPA